MPQITWRNVNAEPQSVEGFLGAGRLFGDAAKGFRGISRDMFKLREEENKYVTNQAIADALSGRVDPSQIRDPRVNAGLLEDAFMAQKTNRSLLKTAALTQEGLGYTNLKGAFETRPGAQEAEEALRRQVQATQIQEALAGVRESDSTVGLNLLRGKLAESEEARTQDTYQEGETSEAQIKALNQFMPWVEDRFYDDLLQSELPAGVDPTPEQMAGFRVKAKALAQGAEGRAMVDDYIQANNFDPAALEKSIYGPLMASELAAQQAITVDRQKRADIAEAALTEHQRNMKIANFSTSVFRDGRVQAGLPDDIKTEKIGSYNQALNYLGDAGFNTSQLADDKENKALMERALAKFPNHSLFVQSVGAYIAPDGELDRKKLSSAMDKVGAAAIFAEINRQRESVGLAPISEEEAPGAAATGKTTFKPRTKEEVEASVTQLQTSLADASAKLSSVDPATPGYKDLLIAFDKMQGIKPVDTGAGLRELSAQPNLEYRANAVAEFDAAFNKVKAADVSRYEHALLQSLQRPQ